ncbi:ABC transporter ATP-binding protein [Brachyspira sp.]|uniref:ABC transporter ATP-binding protein n=1 Tax=Brachyspira sp. TaxID=1977261 RepID=UPI00261A4378|nr:ABC transporter ATP-binding protein [Brachyspira sp.]
MSDNIIVSLKNINVSYDENTILENLNLDIKDKEFLTLLGPSGCGKTTILRTIAGFIKPNSGEVLFDGKVINDTPPYKREVNTVFQRYALFPHLNVFENIAFGLNLKKVPKSEIKDRVHQMLKMVNLENYGRRNINRLSGGQQQRVAIARALINKPRILLLDEPLGALDLKLRKEMQIELKKIQQSLEITFVYVTHDQEEALTMSDTVAVMKAGKILQIGTPEDIYNEPKNAFIADFIGESNIIDGIMHNDYVVEFAGYVFDCVDKGFDKLEKVDVVIRPEDIIVVHPDNANISGLVESAIFKGVHFEMILDAHGYKWIIHSTEKWEAGTEIGIAVSKENIHIMKKTVEEVMI